jgi:hypothetical protein
MSETTRGGGCHCGKVRFEATVDLDRTVTCNCSICEKRGSILSATTKDKFKLLSGEKDLTDYKFNRHVVNHMFCSTCGILPFAQGKKPDGAEMVMVNVRCIDGIDIDALKPMQFDGRNKF